MKLEEKITSSIKMVVDDLEQRIILPPRDELEKRVLNRLLDIENIHLLNTYEIILMIHKELDQLELIDLEFIHTIIFDDINNESNSKSIEFIDPIDNKEIKCKM